MMYSQAWKAMPRCDAVTATSTIWSMGCSGPMRWMTRAPWMPKRCTASSMMASMDFSVMPG